MGWASKPVYWSPKQPEYVTAYWRRAFNYFVFQITSKILWSQFYWLDLVPDIVYVEKLPYHFFATW